MFESASLHHKVDKATFRRQAPKLREALLNAQFDLAQQRALPGAGPDRRGRGRGQGRDRQPAQRVDGPAPHRGERLRATPPTRSASARRCGASGARCRPRAGSASSSAPGTHCPSSSRVSGELTEAEFTQHIARDPAVRADALRRGRAAPQVLVPPFEGAAEAPPAVAREGPRSRWRVTPLDWKLFKKYDRFAKVCEPFLRKTSTGEAPWIVVSGVDPRYRALTVGRHLLDALTDRLTERPATRLPDRTPPLPAPVDGLNVLRALELDQPLSKKDYDRELERWQGRLNLLSRDPRFREISVVAVFEGNDAAGKGGAIRRVTGALDARRYRTVPVAAPTEEERAQPYLWRFWRHLPRRGFVTIFDRSWYGRVLVERVEGYCAEPDWMRAYTEINDFEQQLVRHGVVVAKFWLAISAEEQMKRFKEREKTSFKRFKITAEDWRNRKKWGAYERAVCDMVDRTSTANRAVDAGRGERQALRAGEGPAHAGRGGRARARPREAREEVALSRASRRSPSRLSPTSRGPRRGTCGSPRASWSPAPSRRRGCAPSCRAWRRCARSLRAAS